MHRGKRKGQLYSARGFLINNDLIVNSFAPYRGGAFCRGKGDMIALTATPPKNALAVFGVRVGTVGDYKGEAPLERFGSFGAGQRNCHCIKIQ